MNGQKLSLIAVSLLLGATAGAEAPKEGWAQVRSFSTAAVLPVASTQVETMLAVPWAKASKTLNEPLSVTNLLAVASGASATFYAYDFTKNQYYTWSLVGGAWTASNMSKIEDGKIQSTETPSTAPGEFNLARGVAVMRRDADLSITYLTGNVATEAPGALTLRQGWNFIAPPRVASTPVNDLPWANVAASDLVTCFDGQVERVLRYDADAGWYYWKNGSGALAKKTKVFDSSIPAGQGVWYVRSSQESGSLSWGETPLSAQPLGGVLATSKNQ